MADVKWIKVITGVFDGMSFKKIKNAKIGGKKYRDKLTAVWFELMDFAAKCNHNGAFIGPQEKPFSTISDLSVMIDRSEEELRLCMDFFIKEGMVSFVDDVYMLSNWSKYQNADGLERIREQNRARQKAWYEKQNLLKKPNVSDNVSITQPNAIDKEEEERIKNKDIIKEKKKEKKVEYQLVADIYNEVCTSLPRVTTLSEKRKQAIRARLNTYSIEQFREMFEKAEASAFLKGANPRNWQATFDWLIRDSNFAKVLDGNYADKSNIIEEQTSEKTFDVDDFFNKALERTYGGRKQ